LSWILESHRQNAEFYNLAFRDHGKIRTVPTNSDANSAYWLYTIHVDNRDELMKRLLENGIGASKVHSRNDSHTMFERYKRPLPNADAFERTHLCIPVGWWLSESDRERVAEAVMRFAS
jgi:dTDP-4-amino-4,6-dideoxygalactose transaminase